jgi:glycerophosphoryl diester phosphodiesterase
MLRLTSIYLLAAITHADAVEIIAHRGASHDAPENTLAAVNLGWKRNADAVEVDVFLSKDNRIVAIHDKNTKRTTGHDGLVREMTWPELRKLEAGSWKNKKYMGEPIPLLSDILATIPEGKYLVIEIKCGPEIIQPLAVLLERAKVAPSKTAIISFSFDVVVAAKKQFPKRAVYYLSSIKQNKNGGRWEPSVELLIKKARTAGLNGLSLGNMGSQGAVGNKSLVDYLRHMRKETAALSLGFYVWTVDSPKMGKLLADLGLDGITTNRPAFLKSQLNK